MSASIKPLKNVVPPMKEGEILQFTVLEEQKKVMIKEQEMFDNIEKDQSKRLKAVADKNRKINAVLGAKILAAKKNK